MDRKTSLEIELKRVFPELRMVDFTLLKRNGIELEDFSKAMNYIRKNKLIQDSQELLLSKKPKRDSISYLLLYPNQKEELFFKIAWGENRDHYIGHLQSLDNLGKKIDEIRMYGIKLND
jgi:hypothetical protein